MLVLVPSASHIWVKVIPGGRVHCHWKEPSLATVQERLVVDTRLSGPGGTSGSKEGGCKNVMESVGRGTETRVHIPVTVQPHTQTFVVTYLELPGMQLPTVPISALAHTVT